MYKEHAVFVFGSFNIMSSSSIHFVANDRNLFFLVAEYYFLYTPVSLSSW